MREKKRECAVECLEHVFDRVDNQESATIPHLLGPRTKNSPKERFETVPWLPSETQPLPGSTEHVATPGYTVRSTSALGRPQFKSRSSGKSRIVDFKSAPTSPYAQTAEMIPPPSHMSAPPVIRPPLTRSRSSEKSPKRPNSEKSEASQKSQKIEGSGDGRQLDRVSIGSSQSAKSKFKEIQDWSAAIKPIPLSPPTPPSFTQADIVDPPRPAKAGFEWVWYPEGYWAEREFRDTAPKNVPAKQKWWKRSSDPKSPTRKSTAKSGSEEQTTSRVNTGSPTGPVFFIPQIKLGSLSLKSTTKSSRQASDNGSKRSDFVRHEAREGSQSTKPPLGIYCKTKEVIRNRFRKRSADKLFEFSYEQPGAVTSRTMLLLNGTTSYFDRLQQGRQRPGLHKNASSLESRSGRRIGLAPWHRRHSHDSVLSASSSVYKMFMGRTPRATPNPTKSYVVGSNGKTHPRVDVSRPDPHGTSFFPFEATRISTPPMSIGSPDVEPRGNFFELQAPDSTGHQGYSSRPEHTVSSQSDVTSPSREWWETDTEHRTTGNKSTHTPATRKSPSLDLRPSVDFALNLPEHLPNSPLCPKNPKHPSGGIGNCFYHGRSIEQQRLYKVSTNESG